MLTAELYSLRIYISISCICKEKHSESFEMCSSSTRINLEGKSWIMKFVPE